MSKILYAAGTVNHLKSFHMGYIEALRAEGHEVYTMAKGSEADFDIPFEKKVFSLRNLKCQSEIKKVLRREKFDIIILNTTLAAYNIRAALPRKNRPRVLNIVHGYMFPEEPKTLKDKLFLFVERFYAKKTDDILIMNSEDLRITEKNKLCLGSVKMTRGMGAALPEVKLGREEIFRFMGCHDKFVITFVGELCRGKNQRMLICALPEIKMQIPNAVLWLIGEGISHPELSALAEELSVSDSVFFTGNSPTPCDFIRASDVYVSPSLKEGLPFNIIEALGCGAKILVSDVKGNRDLISDGENGVLFESNNISDFISKLFALRDGEISLDEKKIKESYLKYSKEEVFPETLAYITDFISRK